jgi:hypothetical protein
MRLLRSPLVHFSVIGLSIFALQMWRVGERSSDLRPNTQRIAIEETKISELRLTFHRQVGRNPNGRELDRMIAAEVDEEILFREALDNGLIEGDGGIQARLVQKMLFLDDGARFEDAGDLITRAMSLGLHQDDIVVRRILIQKMRRHAERLQPDQRPSDDDIEQAYQRRSEEYRKPDRRTLVHVFLSEDRRGARRDADATALLEQFTTNTLTLQEAVALGDPFPLGHRLEKRSESDLQRSFGVAFGRDVFQSALNRWSHPISSAYGQHLVWSLEAFPGKLPPLHEVAGRIRSEMVRERRDQRLEEFLTNQRHRYEIDIAADLALVPESNGAPEAPGPASAENN